MGKSTRAKQLASEQKFNEVQSRLAVHNQHRIHADKISKLAEQPLYTHILKYHDKFIRDVRTYELKSKSKDRDKQLLEIVRHAFGKYPVGFPLTSTWEAPEIKTAHTNNDYNHYRRGRNIGGQQRGTWGQGGNALKIDKIDFNAWYICVATGGSLYKEHAKEFLTKKEVHVFINCPHQINAKRAMIFAVAKVAGATDGIALRIAKTKLDEKPFSEWWRSVIRFFAVHETKNIDQINDLIDYLNYENTRLVMRNGEQVPNDFTMAGKNVEGLTKKMTDWHYSLRRVKAIGDARWEGAPIPDDSFEVVDHQEGKAKWMITQIKTAKELAAEGNRMRHCVFSYKQGCVEGRLSIWSLKKADEYGIYQPKVTIELRNNGTITQARGVANRKTKNSEDIIIRLWAAKNGLYYPKY